MIRQVTRVKVPEQQDGLFNCTGQGGVVALGYPGHSSDEVRPKYTGQYDCNFFFFYLTFIYPEKSWPRGTKKLHSHIHTQHTDGNLGWKNK